MTPDESAAMAHHDNQAALSARTPPALVGMTLVEFLRARYDEQEAALKAILDGPNYETFFDCGAAWMHYESLLSTDTDLPIVDFALRDIAGKRAILDMYVDAQASEDAETDQVEKYAAYAVRVALGAAVLHLAQPYKSRPGFDERWTA